MLTTRSQTRGNKLQSKKTFNSQVKSYRDIGEQMGQCEHACVNAVRNYERKMRSVVYDDLICT